MTKKDFPFKVPFINRKEEQKYLLDYFKNQPTSMLFLYWPKSTWKTTLIEKVYKQLPKEDYAVNYLDMRWLLIKDFSDFKSLFFPENIKGKIKNIIWWIKINAWFFGWSVDDESMLKTNIFKVMEEKLREANEKWIKPVIIIDEFQYLRDIIIDEKNNLLLVEELWKFFIRLTKVQHLAHVVCLTSDSYYMEELYNHTKLSKTSKFYMIEHLKKKDIEYWIGEQEWLGKEIVEYFWKNLWGSVWEIWQALISYKDTWDYKSEIQTMIQNEYAKSVEYRRNNLLEEERKKFDTVSTNIAKKWEYNIWIDEKLFFELIKKLVDIDIWFYDVRNQRILPNSQSIKKAFEKIFLD